MVRSPSPEESEKKPRADAGPPPGSAFSASAGPLSVPHSSRERTSPRHTVLSRPAETRCRQSGLTARPEMGPAWLIRSAKKAWLRIKIPAPAQQIVVSDDLVVSSER